MGLPVEVNPLFLENQYAIQRSLRFRASATAYLNRTPASAGNRRTWTYSCWLKRGSLSSAQPSLLAVDGSSDSTEFNFGFSSTDTIGIAGYSTTYRVTTQVFRDPSSWYHLVLAVDTTLSNTFADNRIRLYVNGSEVTAFSTKNNPTQNFDLPIDNNVLHYIGRQGTRYLDGYLAEINLIDGLQLDPTYFGQYNEFGVWSPRKYGGSYGTNGFYLPFTAPNVSSYSGAFNGSNQYLQATLPATLTGAFTVEYFLNRGTSGNQFMFTLGDSATSTGLEVYIGSSGTVLNALWSGSSQITATGNTTAIPVSSWNHLAVTRDSSNNVRLFLNGQQVGSTVTNSNAINNTLRIGVEYFTSSILGYLNGSLSNFRIINGTCLYTSNYSVPAAPLTAVSGTSILTLQSATVIDNSANALTITNNNSVTMSVATPWSNYIAGQDSSGNGNSWTSNNINVTSLGTTYDAMTDVPPPSTIQNVAAGNYAVWNPIDVLGASPDVNSANLNFGGGAAKANKGTFWFSSGKYYFEYTVTTVGNAGAVGVATSSYVLATSGYYAYRNNGTYAPPFTAYGNSYTTNDIIGIAVDMDNGKIWASKNGTWQNSGDPAAGTNPMASGLSGLVTPLVEAYGSGGLTGAANFGQRPFSYTPPSGFLPLNSNNLPAPTIPNGAKVMAATLYTGTGNNQSISNGTNSGNNALGATFASDFVWVKERNSTNYHCLNDIVRGTQKVIFTNTATIEEPNGVSAFNPNGFSLDTWTGMNTNNNTYVAWQWNAGSGTTSSGTGTGGITNVTQSVNVSAGFSVVKYTGSGSAGTVTHGLGVAPVLILNKATNFAYNWHVYFSLLGTGDFEGINNTNAYSSVSNWFNNATTNSTTFPVGASQGTYNYVCYCWAPISGYSSMGTYSGNGSADGPYVYCGFRPRWIMVKASSTASAWNIYDTSRSSYNVSTARLWANTSGAEATGLQIDLLSNGFKWREAGGQGNDSGVTYIYVAFAENPFKLALAR